MICSYGSLQERKPTFRSQSDYEYFDFEFPQQLFKTQLFTQPNQISKQITISGIRAYLGKGKVYHREDLPTISGIKVIFKCKTKGCNARFVYFKKNSDEFMQLIEFKNLHKHKKLKDGLLAKKQQISQFVLHLKGQQFQQFRKIQNWRQRFELNYEEGLALAEQVYWFHKNEDQVLITLAYLGNTIRRVKQNDKTVLIYLQSDGMRQSYLRYGEVVTLEVFHLTTKHKQKQKYVGYFLGQDENVRLVLFAICTIFQESVFVYRKLFEYFHETTCKKYIPFAFVTDQRQTIITALSDFRREHNLKFTHVCSWYHMTKYLISSLKVLERGEQIMKIMCQAMQASDQVLYDNLIEKLQSFIVGQQYKDILENFIKYQHLYCVSKIKYAFSGFAISTSFEKIVMALVANSGVYRVGCGKFFHRLLKIQHELKAVAEKKFRVADNVIKNCPEDFKELYERMENTILEILISLYHKSLDCQLVELDQITLKIVEKGERSYLCKFSIEYDHWQCPCKQLVFTGLPCCHLLRIILNEKYKASLLYYANSRWVYDEDNKVPLSNRSAGLITNKKRRP